MPFSSTLQTSASVACGRPRPARGVELELFGLLALGSRPRASGLGGEVDRARLLDAVPGASAASSAGGCSAATGSAGAGAGGAVGGAASRSTAASSARASASAMPRRSASSSGHALEAAADDAGEAAHLALGDREVREPVDVQVQDASVLLGFVAVEGADQGEGREVDAFGGQAGAADRGEQPLDHVALRGHEHDALARAGGGVDDAERVEVEDGVVERHRHLVLRLEGDRRGELLLVGDGRQLERAQHGALVGHADAHALAEAGVVEQLAQRLAERALVDHFAVAHRVRARAARTAARSARIEPFTRAWTAATKPGWMSSPTTSALRAGDRGSSPRLQVQLRGVVVTEVS